MNILILSREALFPTIGGHKEYLFDYVQQLTYLGHSVNIISWGPEEKYVYVKENLTEYHFKTRGDKLNVNNSLGSPIVEFFSSIGTGQFSTIVHRGLQKIDRQYVKSADIVLKNGPDSNPLSFQIAKKMGIPFVERLDWVGLPNRSHNFDKWIEFIGERSRPYDVFHSYMDKLIIKIEALSAENADWIYTSSPYDKVKISQYLSNPNILYLYPFLKPNVQITTNEEHNFSNKISEIIDSKYLLFYSSPGMDAIRGLKYIIRVAGLYPKYRFVVTGVPDYGLKRPENVLILGFLKAREFQLILRNAYLVLFPIVQSHGFQMKLIRSFSLGKAVLSTESLIEPFKPLVRNYTNIAIQDNPLDFHKELAYLYEEDSIVRKISIGSFNMFKDNFSPDSHLMRLKSLLSHIISCTN